MRFRVFIVILRKKSFLYVYLKELYWNEMDRKETEYLIGIIPTFVGHS